MACKRIRSKMRKMSVGGNIFGALKTVGGAALTATGVGGPLGIGLMSSGIGDIAGGIAEKRQLQQQERQDRLLKIEQQFASMDILPGQESYTPLMPDGGQVGYETVELEKGEPYQLPDGTIESIPTSAPSHAKGGVVIDLPSGTRVLGKKKAMNGKQFKELGRKLKNSQSKYNKSMEENPTSIETRTAKRMLKNINTEYDKLFKAQGEDIGTGKRFGKGGKVKKYYGENESNDYDMTIGGGKSYSFGSTDTYNPTDQFVPELNFDIPFGGQDFRQAMFNPKQQYNINSNSLDQITAGNNGSKEDQGFDWQNALSTAGALAPTAYNLYQSQQPIDAWREEEFKNPYAEGSRRLMRSRRYNVQPELEAGRSNVAAYNRRLRESGLSKGQLMGGLQAGSLAKTKSDASTLARAQNVNAQYMAEQAKFDYGVGEDISRRRQMIRDYNARAEAARQNMADTGLSQMSQYSQLQQYQRNQQGRDAQRLALLPDYIQNYLYNPKAGYNFITK